MILRQNRMNEKLVKILLVEDNSADARWIMEVFKEYQIPNEIHLAKDGAEAMEYLYKKGKYENVSSPDLIILDLYLPRINGHEILKKIKNDKKLRTIPVVVLTASNSPEDPKIAYKNHANCYISKPVDFKDLVKIIHYTGEFWLKVAEIPEFTETSSE